MPTTRRHLLAIFASTALVIAGSVALWQAGRSRTSVAEAPPAATGALETVTLTIRGMI